MRGPLKILGFAAIGAAIAACVAKITGREPRSAQETPGTAADKTKADA